MTTIQVFLNTDGHDGFHNAYSPPSVRLAARFELPDRLLRQLSAGVPVAALEAIYEQLNIGGTRGIPAAPSTVRYRNDGNRSLSVGDVVVVGETAYAVTKSSWLYITTDQLLDAILNGRMVSV
jgi:hypothetical protein